MKRWWCAALAAMISCGGTDTDGPIESSTEGVCGFYAEKYCAAEEHCWAGFVGNWNDRATCQEAVKLGCASRLSAPGVNDTSSRVVACANALTALSCAQYNDEDRQLQLRRSLANKSLRFRIEIASKVGIKVLLSIT